MENTELIQIAVALRERQQQKRQRTPPLARQIPPSPRERQRELDGIAEQSYDQLDGEWHQWLEVARKYEHKALYQDRLDIRHDIILELYHARQRDGKPIPILRAYRIASLTVALYWRRLKSKPTILSLESEIEISEGEIVELKDTIADDNAIDLEAWLNEATWRLGCPMRLIQIAHKRLNGEPLNDTDRRYFNRHKAKELARCQKTLF